MPAHGDCSRSLDIFMRGLIWGFVGLIYAPLFTGIYVICWDLGLEHWSFVPAAALAGGVGAPFYGARQVALVGTLVGARGQSASGGVLQPDRVPGHSTSRRRAAGSVWVVVGPFIDAVDGAYVPVVADIVRRLPAAMLGGVVGGAVAGSMLEAFGFAWVHNA